MGEEYLKVVLDANIFISFFLTKGKTIASILDLWRKDIFLVFVSPEIKTEIKKSFQYPKIRNRLTSGDIRNLDLLLEEVCILLYPKPVKIIKSDPKDNMYLACAKEAQANFLVTGDKKHLLPLKKFGKTKIVSPKEFIELLDKNFTSISTSIST